MKPEQAKQLKPGCQVYYDLMDNADGTPQVWRVTGKVKLWKTRPDEFKIPIKRGLYQYGYLTQENVVHFHMTQVEAIESKYNIKKGTLI